MSSLSIQNFFRQKGILFPIGGNKPQILDDDNYVWMVEQGEISVFLTTLTPDCKPGVKTFLFTVREGDLLFGMTLKVPRRKVVSLHQESSVQP